MPSVDPGISIILLPRSLMLNAGWQTQGVPWPLFTVEPPISLPVLSLPEGPRMALEPLEYSSGHSAGE